VFHIGGDDFAAVWKGEGAKDWAKTIQRKFAKNVKALYDPGHQQLGIIRSTDRKGKLTDFPLMTVLVGIVISGLSYKTETELSNAVAKAKKQAKNSDSVICYQP
jgi:GGDEF domain-containing protein